MVQKSASDPVLPAQSGQGPAIQGSMVSGSVSPFSGTYTTSVPIEVLPGRNGLQPAVSLSYGSTNVDGLAGVGWGIPSSSITRTGPSKAAPTYGREDEFYMSLNGAGVQLIPLQSGPGSDGTLQYKTRIDSQSNVIAHFHYYVGSSGVGGYSDQVAYWEVWSKSGERYFFGPSADDSDIDDYCLWLPPRLGYDEDRHRNQWMLRKVIDTDGNTMTYRYNPAGNHSPYSFLPSLILYGGNDNLGGYSNFAGVHFIYEERPDKRFSYRNGMQQTIGDRLKEVITGPCAGEDVPYGASARKYALSYAISRTTGRSLLSQVAISGYNDTGTETVLPRPITFTYADYAASDPMAWDDGSGVYGAGAMPGLAISEGFFKAGDNNYGGTKSLGSAFMDLNGDGLPDKVDSFYWSDYNGSHGSQQNIYINPGPGGASWTQVASPSIPGQPIANFYSDRQYQQSNLDTGVRFGDINGDGIPDKIDCAQYVNGDSSSAVYLANADGTGWMDTPAGSIHQVNDRIFSDPSTWLLPALVGSGGRPTTVLPEAPARQVVAPTLRHGEAIGAGGKGGGGEIINTVSCDLRITPPATTAGGQVYFFWEADGLYVPPSGDDQQGASVQYYLSPLESTWGPSQEKFWPGYAVYSNLPPNAYTFHIKATNHGGQSVTNSYSFTVYSSFDNTPPTVTLTSTPSEGWLHGDLGFEWTGLDNSGPVQYEAWLIPYGTPPTAWGTGTQASYAVADPFDGTFLLVGMDAMGNMAAVEWAFSGGKLRPPFENVIWTNGQNAMIRSQPQGTVYMDLNGDGYADAGRFFMDATGIPQVAVSLWNPTYDQWVAAPEWSENATPLVKVDENNDVIDLGVRLMDVNGDGLPDFAKSFNDVAGGSYVRMVRFNTGCGWTEPVIDPGSYGDVKGQPFSYREARGSLTVTSDAGAWLLDINGDGLPDKVDAWNPADNTTQCSPFGSPSKGVHLNTGTGFSDTEGLAPYQSSPPSTETPGYAFSEWFTNTFRSGAKAIASRDTGVRVVDLNGDGLLDFIQMQDRKLYNASGGLTCDNAIRRVRLGTAQNANSARLDYLVAIGSPIGGTTEITYESAKDAFGPGDFCPVMPYVVTSVKEADGKGAVYETSYDYAHPKWDTVERQFAGFGEVIVHSPDGQHTKNYYLQNYPYTGLAWKTESYDSSVSATLYATSTTDYTSFEETELGRFKVYNVRKLRETATTSEAGSPLTTEVDYAYSGPPYYNLTEVKTQGDTSISSDDKTVRTQYANVKLSDRWLIGYATLVETFDSTGTNRTSAKQIIYDNGALTRGHATEERDWLDWDTQSKTKAWFNGYLTTATVSYNLDGTLAGRTDAMGILTTFGSYDSTKRFPLSKTVHGASSTYTTTVETDTRGRPKSVTDAKGVTTGTYYDGLGRPMLETVQYPGQAGPSDTKRYIYHDELMGQPNSQEVEVITYLGGQGLSSVVKYDGLGRTYQTDSPGWQGQRIYTETTFDPSGRVSAKSRPHFSSSPVQWVQYTYDPRSRVMVEEGFGKTTTTTFQSPLQMTVTTSGTGATGNVSHTKVTQADAYGRLVMVQHDTMPPVYYEYDNKDALVAAHEASPSGTPLVALTYDAWGRKLSYQDYDAGTPTTNTDYYYDHQGRLIRQRETPNSDASKFRQTDLAYGGDLGQLTYREGTDDEGSLLTESLTYYGSNQGLNTGETYTRIDASGSYSFSTSFSSGRIHAETVLQTTFDGAPASYTFSSEKDIAGRTLQVNPPGGGFTAYAFDPQSGLATSVTDEYGFELAHYQTYDETHLTNWQRGNGVATTYTHDPVTDDLTRVYSGLGSVGLQDQNYQFLGDRQVYSVTDAVDGFSQTFGYDAAMRLTQASGPYGALIYGYDGTTGGRLTAKGEFGHGKPNWTASLSYDPAYKHRVTARSDGYSFQYNAWGEVSWEGHPDGTEISYAYDCWGRMAGVKGRSDDSSPWSQKATYTYSAGGERLRTLSYDRSGITLEHLFLSGYEVEQVSNGYLRYRYAIDGPNRLLKI